jgi:hypothetical protein
MVSLRNTVVVSTTLALVLGTAVLLAPADDPPPQAHQEVAFDVGEMVADHTRDYIYLIDKSGRRIFMINMATCRTERVASLAGSPSWVLGTSCAGTGIPAVSVDGTRLFVPLPEPKKIQVFSLPNLTPSAVYSCEFSPLALACGAGNRLYATDGERHRNVRQMDATTGAVLRDFNGGIEYYRAFLRSSADGNRLLVSEWGLSGSRLEEFDVSSGGAPVLANSPHGAGSDTAFDSADRTIYVGSYSGAYSRHLDTGATTVFDSGGRGAAVVPARNLAYFGFDLAEYAGDVRRFRTSDGTMDGEFVLLGTDQDGQRFFDRHLEAARNGKVLGVKNSWTWNDFRGNYFNFWAGVIGNSTLDLNPPGNSPPVAHPKSVTTTDGTPVAIGLSASDADGNGLTYELISQPEHGWITDKTAPGIVYSPERGYVGPDSFSFRVHDGNVYSGVATVTISVVPANNPPVITGAIPSESTVPPVQLDPLAVSIQDGYKFVVFASDQDLDKLTYTWKLDGVTLHIASEEDTILANQYTFLPDAADLGRHVFKVVVTDGRGGSAVYEWDVLVTDDQNAPVILASSPGTPIYVEMGTTARFEVEAADPDGDALSYAWLVGSSRELQSSTTDTMECRVVETHQLVIVRVSDGRGRVTENRWTVLGNYRPQCNDFRISTDKNTPRSFTLVGGDVDDRPEPHVVTYEVVTPPGHGELTGPPSREVTYTPDPGYAGGDSFTYRIYDGNAYSDPATVTITVNDTNAQPVVDSAMPASPLSMEAGSSETFEVWASDPDDDPLTYQWKLNDIPIDGATDTSCRYTPRAEDAGRQMRLAVIVSDPKGARAAHVWYITVTSPLPAIALSAPNMNVQCQPGENPAPRTFQVWNAGPGTLQYTVGVDQPWLSVSPAAGISTGEKDLITVNFVDVDKLDPGARYAKITVTATGAANSPQKLSVYLCVLRPPAVACDKDSLSASCDKGTNAAPGGFKVWNDGDGTLEYEVTADASWVSCSPNSGSSDGEEDEITVNFDTSGLAPGTYHATVTVAMSGTAPASADTTKTIDVAVTVADSGSGGSGGSSKKKDKGDGGGGGGGGGGCSLSGSSADPVSGLLPYAFVAAAWLLGRFRRRSAGRAGSGPQA